MSCSRVSSPHVQVLSRVSTKSSSFTVLAPGDGAILLGYTDILPILVSLFSLFRVIGDENRQARADSTADSLLSLAEPTGNVAPRIAGERYEGGKLVDVPRTLVVALDCSTQGFPVPVTRYFSLGSHLPIVETCRDAHASILTREHAIAIVDFEEILVKIYLMYVFIFCLST